MRTAAILGMAAMLSVAVVAQGARPPGGGGSGGHQGPPPGANGGGGRGQGGQNGSGPTSRPSPEQIFDHVDTDHNGVISQSEFAAFLAHRPPRPPGPSNSNNQNNGNAKSGSTSRPSAATLFKRADSDGNGVLSKAEFTSFLQSHRPPGGGPPPTSRPAD